MAPFPPKKNRSGGGEELQHRQLDIGWYFPSTYQVGMSGLGFQLVWWLMESRPDTWVKRGFLDIAEEGIESIELLGFTVAWELDFINISTILQKHGVSLTPSERLQAGDGCPLVFGGGPVLSANPEPFADFFDVILLGDAESSVPAFLDAWQQARQLPDKQEQLRYLSKTKGLYIPSLYTVSYDPVSQAISSIDPIDDDVPPSVEKEIFKAPDGYAVHTQILSDQTTWSNTFLIEVVRSCPQECRFCLASYLTRPFRATAIDTIVERVDFALQHTKRIGLLGPSVTEHPLFENLVAKFEERPDIDLTVASVRADTLTPSIIKMLKILGQKSVTIAIESGSERLRQIMKKNLSQDEIFEAVRLIDEGGLQGVKFYGIVGLPYETDADLEQTVALMAALKKRHKRLRFVFGVSSFVPKAQTPFQWAGRDKKAQAKLEYMRKHLSKIGIEVRPESHNWSDIQGLISRGDRRLAPLMRQIAKTEGSVGDWKRALRNLPKAEPGLDFYAFRDIEVQEVLPWQHISPPQKEGFLVRHADQAKLLAQSPVKELK